MKCLCGKEIKEEGNKLCSDCIISKKYVPRYKEFEQEYISDMTSDECCEYSSNDDDYMILYKYTQWLEDKYSKRVDMSKRKGYRF